MSLPGFPAAPFHVALFGYVPGRVLTCCHARSCCIHCFTRNYLCLRLDSLLSTICHQVGQLTACLGQKAVTSRVS